MVSLIWAQDEDLLIGAKNKMPWHYKEDLIYYKNMTKDSAVIMGYNTYLSLKGYYPNKPFPYKKTYVLSFEKIEDDMVETVLDLDEFKKNLHEDLFVVGGKSLYEQFMDIADTLYVTQIPGHHEGDTYMKPIDLDVFYLDKEVLGEKVKFQTYKRK